MSLTGPTYPLIIHPSVTEDSNLKFVSAFKDKKRKITNKEIMESSNRTKIVLGVVIVVTVLAFVFIALFAGSALECEFLEEVPDKQMSRIGHTLDFKNLVSYSAYLKYNIPKDSEEQNSSKPILLLYLTEYFKVESTDDTHLVELGNDCANFTMKVNKSQDGKTMLVESIKVDLRVPNKDVKSCVIRNPQISYDLGKHYKCPTGKVYECTTTSNGQTWRVAQLIFNTLEFELDGNTDSIKDDNFSTPPQECS